MLTALAMPALLCWAFAQAPSATPRWEPGLIREPAAWSRAGSGTLAVTDAGLRLVVDQGWCAGVVEPVILPRDAGKVRLSIRLGGGGRLIMQVAGDLHTDGKQRMFSPAWGSAMEGTYERPLDPRAVKPAGGKPLKVVVSIEGPKGAWGEVSALDFLPMPRPAPTRIAGQKSIFAVDLMPNLPKPYRMLDWKRVCRDFDALTFDTRATGPNLPLCRVGADAQGPFFAQTTYIGDDRAETGAGESINSMWAVIGAAYSGIDKRKQGGQDWVKLCDAWFCTDKGLNLLTDYRPGPTPLNYWYDLQPSTAYAVLLDLYPGRPEAERIWRTSVDTLARVHDGLKGSDGVPDYDFSGYDYAARRPAATGSKEPDNAGHAAWLFYAAYKRTGERAYLNRALECFRFWDRYGDVPIIETGVAWGAAAAVRMNAELGLRLPADRYVQRAFAFSHEGIDHNGVGVDRWGGIDVCGLWHDPASKAYMVESAQWSILAGVARYDPAYARAMGKWVLNLANSLRLFYPSEVPPESQSCWDWKGDPKRCIPYERINWGRRGKWLTAGSDAPDYNWPVKDLSLYSGASAAFMAGLIDTTNVPGILRLDLRMMDVFAGRTYPTYLLYNPHPDSRTVTVAVGPKPVDLYDTVTKRFVARRCKGQARVALPADRAAVLVLTPAGGKLQRQGHRLSVGDAVVDFAAR
jgi:hypothetical protein